MTERRRTWHPPSFIAWCAVIFITVLMLGLGLWQLQRLAEKEALIARIAESAARPPARLLPLTEAALRASGFMKFQVQGEFLHAHEMHLAARYYKNQLGYQLLTPLRLLDGRILLTNRGWVPTNLKDPAKRPETLVEGVQYYTVILRTDRDHTPFTPDHDIPDNIWFWRDIATMKEVTGLDLLPVSADIISTNADPEEFPIPGDGTFALRNDHLGYAITWFMVGLAAIAVFFFYHWRPAERK